MSELIASGLSTAQAAEAATTMESPPAGPGALDPNVASRLVDAMVQLDEPAAHGILDLAFAALSFEAAARLVVLPSLREIGERCARGEMSIADEHFASNLIRARLLSLSRGWGGAGARHAILACPAGEQHDLALIVSGLVLRGLGWRITYLGPNTPAETIGEAAKQLRPDAILITATGPERISLEAPQLQELARSQRVVLAGPEAVTALADGIGAASLSSGPIEGAHELAASAAASSARMRA
ncbi:MAG: cobalamin B12-binding domain-containing protein [Actinomycetota bacterium]|nr:cobalamin B12-binding domain-containing protein [Actinomycetota bacterium]